VLAWVLHAAFLQDVFGWRSSRCSGQDSNSTLGQNQAAVSGVTVWFGCCKPALVRCCNHSAAKSCTHNCSGLELGSLEAWMHHQPHPSASSQICSLCLPLCSTLPAAFPLLLHPAPPPKQVQAVASSGTSATAYTGVGQAATKIFRYALWSVKRQQLPHTDPARGVEAPTAAAAVRLFQSMLWQGQQLECHCSSSSTRSSGQ